MVDVVQLSLQFFGLPAGTIDLRSLIGIVYKKRGGENYQGGFFFNLSLGNTVQCRVFSVPGFK